MTDDLTLNWGRWGFGDERGALNLIDSRAVLRGLGAARRGQALSLGWRIGSSSSPVIAGRRGAIQHYMMKDGGDSVVDETSGDFTYAEDYIGLPVHSATTHLDALAHGWLEGLLYNGFPASAVNSRGARRCGVEKVGAIVTRGWLLDLPRSLGVEALDKTFAIQGSHLDEAAHAVAEPEPGDALLIRTGWANAHRGRPRDLSLEEPGLDVSAVDWIRQHDVAVVGTDTLSTEVQPSSTGTFCPVHVRLLRALGVPLLELLQLEELAATGVTSFCLVVAPLLIQGGTGSPVNPVAVI